MIGLSRTVVLFLVTFLNFANVITSFTVNYAFSPSSGTAMRNTYDDWRQDVPVDQMPLDEDAVFMCLDELVYSDSGKQMFGVHDGPASIGITGEIGLLEIEGPEVYLSLSGNFWHTRSHVLGRAAMYLNARIPEIMHVSVSDPDILNDFEEVIDEDTGEIIEVIDRKSPDFNGDRETMTYQGIDPDMRGPFVSAISGEFKIIPS
mmetsp:Transcript_9465/g.14186  ORF Transcript_9465/g.14186 Transcript_9465/m.14186 type:complete len:204 (-) Transcript_9465:94-705(-)